MFMSLLQSIFILFSLWINISEQSISINPSAENFADGNRRKFRIKLYTDDQNSGSEFMDQIGQRFRRYVKNIIRNEFKFNDSHYVAEVHWSGSNSSSIMILMKDPFSMMTAERPSHFYVSRDYGKTFKNITSKFILSNGTLPVISEFFSSKANNQHYILVAKFHKMIFISYDECKTFHNVSTSFYPAEIKYHPRFSYYVLAHESTMGLKQLYVSTNNGQYWRYKALNVVSFSWGYYYPVDRSTYIYYHKKTAYVSELWKTTPWSYYWRYYQYGRIQRNISDFELINQYIFVTKNGSKTETRDLYISVNRGSFHKALFPFKDLQMSKSFVIGDATENDTLVAVSLDDNTANLYISDTNGTKFSLSLPGILYNVEGNSRYFSHEFVELFKVDGVSGVYIATNLTNGTVGHRKFISWITFDKGGEWSLLKPPVNEQKTCKISEGCSLHVSHEFGYHNPFTRFTPMYAKKSAPGFIIATGNTGKGLSKIPSVYMSTDAGLNWKKLFDGHYFYGFVDHGGVILAVKKYGNVDSLIYSWDEGHSWLTYKFVSSPVRVYGLLTEPGEMSTVFTIFCSNPNRHSWLLIEIDIKNVLGVKCKQSDYTFWELKDERNSSEHCMLGKKQRFERRLSDRKCFNGYNYDRAITVSNCLCTREDFMCDFGYKEIEYGWFGSYCFPDSNFINFTTAEPSWCSPGKLYNVSKGYRKVPGDTCYGGLERAYMPETRACKIEKSTNFLFYAARTAIYRYDIDQKKAIRIELNGMRDVIALDYSYDEQVLFYGDFQLDKIMMLNISSGHLHEVLQFDESRRHIEGLAYDWMNYNMYYTDTGSSEIGLISIRSHFKFKKILFGPTDVAKPRGIVVDPPKGYMFWTDVGSKGIYRADLDGSNKKKLISFNVNKPNGIALDYKNSHIFWVDAISNKIESATYDGNDRKVIVSSRISQPYSLDVIGDKVYWNDWSYHSIRSADKKTGNSIENIVRWIYRSMALKAFSSDKQAKTGNPCDGKICSYVCLPLSNNRHTCACPEGLSLGTDNKTCHCKVKGEVFNPLSGLCREDNSTACSIDTQFTCETTHECIPKHWKCDGDNDCTDKSDELNCDTPRQCQAGYFRCRNTRCILNAWHCDGENDCSDNSDEIGCKQTTNCSTIYRACANGQCILSTWFCDGEDDCSTGSDELNCATTTTPVTTKKFKCSSPNFSCKSGGYLKCFPQSFKCDNSPDCDDQSDEKNCKDAVCVKNQWRCADKKLCIWNSQHCDGVNQCIDGSDEQNCTVTPTPIIEPVNCPTGFYYCDKRSNCYQKRNICDGTNDCKDRSDEKDCGRNPTTTTTTTTKYCAMRCSNKCLMHYQICDGIRDCTNGKDEQNCNKGTCDDGFACNNGTCLDKSRMCNGRKDCVDGEDESKNICEKGPKGITVDCNLKPPFSFSCTNDKSICYNTSVECDGQDDCSDLSDEVQGRCRQMKRVRNLRVPPESVKETSIRIEWNHTTMKAAPGDFKGYNLQYIAVDDAKLNSKPHIVNVGMENSHTVNNLKPCTEYIFAVAMELKSMTNALYVDRTITTKGQKILPKKQFTVRVHYDSLVWNEQSSACYIKYNVAFRKLKCSSSSPACENKDVVEIERDLEAKSTVNVRKFFPANIVENKYKCKICVMYEGLFIASSNEFRYPPKHNYYKATASSKVYIWAIPVSIVVLVLFFGLGIMVYKYRRLQNSFLAFAARGNYTRQEDVLDDDDDDGIVVGFRTGEDAPMINRFSDDEPLVVA